MQILSISYLCSEQAHCLVWGGFCVSCNVCVYQHTLLASNRHCPIAHRNPHLTQHLRGQPVAITLGSLESHLSQASVAPFLLLLLQCKTSRQWMRIANLHGLLVDAVCKLTVNCVLVRLCAHMHAKTCTILRKFLWLIMAVLCYS